MPVPKHLYTAIEEYMQFGFSREESFLLLMRPTMAGIAIASIVEGSIRCWRTINGGWDNGEECNTIIYPKLYKNLATALRSLTKFKSVPAWQSYVPPETLEIVFWIAPQHEWTEIALDQYRSISGRRYPGSPRQ